MAPSLAPHSPHTPAPAGGPVSPAGPGHPLAHSRTSPWGMCRCSAPQPRPQSLPALSLKVKPWTPCRDHRGPVLGGPAAPRVSAPETMAARASGARCLGAGVAPRVRPRAESPLSKGEAAGWLWPRVGGCSAAAFPQRQGYRRRPAGRVGGWGQGHVASTAQPIQSCPGPSAFGLLFRGCRCRESAQGPLSLGGGDTGPTAGRPARHRQRSVCLGGEWAQHGL